MTNFFPGCGGTRRTRIETIASPLLSNFWRLISATILTLASLAASEWWADINNEQRLTAVIRALTPLLLIRGLIVLPDSLLRRDMKFRSLALRTNVSVIGGGIVAIGAASLGAGVWALVYQQLTTAVLELAIVWRAVVWRPKLRFTRTAFVELIGFSWPSAVASFGVFANSRVDALIVGLFLGTTVVGLYRFAVRLVNTLLEAISGSIRAVSLPELARLQSQHEQFVGRVLLLYRITSVACLVPLSALAAAGPAIVQLLGDEWEPAAGAIAILCLAGVGRVVGQLVGPILQSVGRPGRLAVLSWVAAVISALTLLSAVSTIDDWTISSQVRALALVTLGLHGVVFLLLNLTIVGRNVGIPTRTLASSLTPGLGAGLAGFVVGRLIDSALTTLDAPTLLRCAGTGGSALLAAGVVASAREPRLRHMLVSRLGR